MTKVELKEKYNLTSFSGKCTFNECDKSDESIISTFNTLQDLMMDKFMNDPDKSIETY